MGTSTRNKGQSAHTPLVPAWLDDEQESAVQPDGEAIPIPPDGDENRFRGPRTTFTQYINGGGRDGGSMRKTVSRYVGRTLGGSTNATKRLGSARKSTASLYDVLQTLSGGGGIRSIEQDYSIDNLEGLSAKEFFTRIAVFVCPDGGPNDEGMARSAYFEVISEFPDFENKSPENLSGEECQEVLQRYIGKVIMEHIVNDIANKIIVLPDSISSVSDIEGSIEQMIMMNVSDAFAVVNEEVNVTNSRAQNIVDRVYHKIYDLLESMGD